MSEREKEGQQEGRRRKKRKKEGRDKGKKEGAKLVIEYCSQRKKGRTPGHLSHKGYDSVFSLKKISVETRVR